MKKFLEGLGVVVLALALVGGGYFAGQRVQLSSIISAMPKHTIDKQRDGMLPEESFIPEGEPEGEQIPPVETEADRNITKSETSAVDETWSEVMDASNDSGEKLTLYTSAEKDGDEFIWDDTQKWVLELSDGDGGYYTLYDQQITNGNVYFEVAERENGEKIVYLYALTGAGVSVTQYTRTDSGFTEKNVFNSGAVNRTFTSVPAY